MTYKLLTVFSVLLFYGQQAMSQYLIEGLLLNKEKGQPVPFASVGIERVAKGTITDSDGTFSLSLSKEHLKDSLTFSSIGYQKISLPVSSLIDKDGNTIFLEEKATILEEIAVNSEKLSGPKRRTLGNSQHNTGTMRLDSKENGGAMALLVSNKENPFRLTEARLFIVNSSFPSYKIRLRVMDVDLKSGLPGKDLMKQDYVLTSTKERGWIDFKLTDKNVQVADKDFFIVFEWIMDSNDKLILSEQLSLHLSETPDDIIASTLSINGKKVEERIIKDFKKGIWFGSLIHPLLSKNYKCFYRLNAMDKWRPSAAILTAKVSTIHYKGK